MLNKYTYLKTAHLLFGAILIVAFVQSSSIAKNSHSENLVVFSGRKEPLIKPVIDLFEKNTGITVVLKTGQSTALGQQILQEIPNPSADVYIAKESGSLEFLRAQNAFLPYTSQATASIPAQFKASDGTWLGVSGRSRALIINTDMIKKEEAPKTLEELQDSKWKGKLAAVNSGNESFIAWVSALRIQLGEEGAKNALMKLIENDIHLLSKSHTDIRKAIGRGEYPMGLINHYYFHLQKKEPDESLRHVEIIYLDQSPDGRGELINVSGAGIVKGAKNLDNAKQFIDFLASQEAQKLFAEVNFEYPLLPGVPTHDDVLSSLNCQQASAVECISRMNVRLDQLGQQLDQTMNMLEEIQWY